MMIVTKKALTRQKITKKRIVSRKKIRRVHKKKVLKTKNKKTLVYDKQTKSRSFKEDIPRVYFLSFQT